MKTCLNTKELRKLEQRIKHLPHQIIKASKMRRRDMEAALRTELFDLLITLDEHAKEQSCEA